MKNVQNGIYFLVSDSVSGDNSNLFKEYHKALRFYNDDSGTDGGYNVKLCAVYIEDDQIINCADIMSKFVPEKPSIY